VPFRHTSPVFFVAVLGVLLGGCSSPPLATPDTSADDLGVEESTDAGGEVAPPATLTWESACLLSVAEVKTIMQSYDWQPSAAPEANTIEAGGATCDYSESDPNSIRDVIIDVWAYDSASTYGWISPNYDVPSFTAPDPATGAQNAWATATAALGSAGYAGICTTVGDVPVVIDPNRLAAVVFPAGTFFYVVRLNGIYGSEQEKDPLLAISSLLASRALVAH